jgi:hypothetical protein
MPTQMISSTKISYLHGINPPPSFSTIRQIQATFLIIGTIKLFDKKFVMNI